MKIKQIIFHLLISLLFLLTLTKSKEFLREKVIPNQLIKRDIPFHKDWEFKNLDDRSENPWKKVQIPHDFSISEKFDPVLESESAFLPGGIGYYQKKFTLPADAKDSSIILNFEGVYSDAYVFINNKYIGENHYGYNPFAFDISNYVTCDDKTENLLEVRVENNMPTTRYYSGSGIYRMVTLSITGKIHVSYNGVQILTPGISKGDGTAKIFTEVDNEKDEVLTVRVEHKIVDKSKVYFTKNEKIMSPKSTLKFEDELKIDSPTLWSLENPYLYNVETSVYIKGDLYDKYVTTFGFRYFEFNTKHGFELNGVPTKLHGVCQHHDQGPLGSASYYDSLLRQVEIIKEMGMNSIRTSHNIPDKDFIKICDKLGVLVDEEAFDGWKLSKHHNPNDFGKYFKVKLHPSNKAINANPSQTWAEYSIKAMVKRDRNSPSVILWSLGNEIDTWTQTQPPDRILDSEYPQICQDLINWTKSLDTTRPVTLGDNGWVTREGSAPGMGDKWKAPTTWKIYENGGVMGYNYGERSHVTAGLKDWGVLYHSESVSAVNSRGVYSLTTPGGDKAENTDGHYHITSYDEDLGAHHEYLYRIWYFDDINGGLSGQYIWTGFDYLGEPTPWNAPFRAGTYYEKDLYDPKKDMGPYPNTAYFGLIDTAGFPKDTYYLYRSQCKRDSVTLHLVNGWDENNIAFIDKTSSLSLVAIYSNANIVKLYRGDVHIGTAKRQNITTKAGYTYHTYSVQSLVSPDICKAVEPSPNDEGTALYARFQVKFDKNERVSLYLKGFDSEESTEEIKNTVGTSRLDPIEKDKFIFVKSDKNSLKVGGNNLAFIVIDLRDKNSETGNLKTAYVDQIKLTCTLNGNGKILAVDNGDQAIVDKFQQKSVLPNDKLAYIKTYAGKALVIVTSTEVPGNIEFTVSGEGVESKIINIVTE